MPVPSVTEKLLKHDQLIVLACIVLLIVSAWWYLLNSAGMPMSIAEMTQLSLIPYQNAGMAIDMPEMGMQFHPWSWQEWMSVFFMWWLMMVAMMLPSATPTILLYARVMHHAKRSANTTIVVPTSAFMLGYLCSWLIFSIIATFLNWALEQSKLLSFLMIMNNGFLSGFLLIAVGMYQLSPLKQACLKHCQSPATFIAKHMQAGQLGAYKMGVEHGAYCVGCCWLLMLLLFVGGVMNIVWIAILSIFVLLEKTLPQTVKLPQLSAFLLLVWGTIILIVQISDQIK